MQRLLLLLVFCSLSSWSFAQRDTLKVELTNITAAEGRMWIGVYTSEEDFLNREKARLLYYEVTATGSMQIEIPDLEAGKEYALGIFHDIDNDGDLNTNWLGLPAEPWAMSAPLRSLFRAPRFEEMAFVFRPQNMVAFALKKL